MLTMLIAIMLAVAGSSEPPPCDLIGWNYLQVNERTRAMLPVCR